MTSTRGLEKQAPDTALEPSMQVQEIQLSLSKIIRIHYMISTRKKILITVEMPRHGSCFI